MNKKIYIYTLLLLPLLLSVGIFAQADEFGGGIVPIDIIAEPKEFVPGSEILLRASYYLTDVDRINFDWFVNGKRVSSGIGKKSITVIAPKLGEPLVVKMNADAPNGRFLTKSITIRTADVDLLWETDTTSPMLYKGKTLPSNGSLLKIVALPHFVSDTGGEFDSSDLFYEWRVAGKKLISESGKGKNFIFTNTKQLSNHTDIEVKVSTLGRTYNATGRTSIVHVIPEVLLYEKKPLFGVDYSLMVPDIFELPRGEATIKAEEYNFPIGEGGKRTISWEVNGDKTNKIGDTFTILREPGANSSGIARLSVVIDSIDSILQTIKREVNIRF